MFAVIMAGGSGTRFWPASRERLPKQFLKITSDRTMFEETIDRIRGVVAVEDIYSVVGRAHRALTEQALGVRNAPCRDRILVEPVARNTAAAIGLAALHIRSRQADAPIIVLPADHFIAGLDNFASTVRAAAEVAATGAIVTIGIEPDRPETGYGYLQIGDPAGNAAGKPYYRVARFVEKPDQQTALEYLASRQFAWNSGIFLFTARTILAEIETCFPELAAGLSEINDAMGAASYEETVARVYSQLPSVSVDYGVMEKTAAPVYVFKADFAWSDVGSWQALYELRAGEADAEGNLLLADAVAIDAAKNLVYSTTGRPIALLGVEGLIVVDTPDALLVGDRNRSQDVKQFAEIFRGSGRTDVC